MNPRDIMTDAIHNFHPQYQQYTQYSSTASTKVISQLNCHRFYHDPQGGHKRNGSYEGVDSNEPQPPMVKMMMKVLINNTQIFMMVM